MYKDATGRYFCDKCDLSKTVQVDDPVPHWQCPECTAMYSYLEMIFIGYAKKPVEPDTLVQIKLEPKGKLPCKAHPSDACYDCYANEDLTLYPGKAYAVSLGFALAIPEGWQAKILPRSGLSLKGLRVLNAPGTVDSAYRGPVKALLKWEGMGYMDVHVGDRLVQMEFQRVPTVSLVEVTELSSTDRGEGGFGSTGIK
jgi:dUTP pyrophosphatase